MLKKSRRRKKRTTILSDDDDDGDSAYVTDANGNKHKVMDAGEWDANGKQQAASKAGNNYNNYPACKYKNGNAAITKRRW